MSAIDVSRCNTVGDLARAICRAWPDSSEGYPNERPAVVATAMEEVEDAGADIYDAVDFLNRKLSEYDHNVAIGEPLARKWLAGAAYQLRRFILTNIIHGENRPLPGRKYINVKIQ